MLNVASPAPIVKSSASLNIVALKSPHVTPKSDADETMTGVRVGVGVGSIVGAGVVGHHPKVDARGVRQLQRAEDPLAVSLLEALVGAREDHLLAADDLAGALLADEHAVLELLEHHGLTHAPAVAVGDHLDAGGRQVEADVAAPDDPGLADHEADAAFCRRCGAVLFP